MAAKWIRWNGSREQIAEISASNMPVVVRYSSGREVKWSNSLFIQL